MSFYSPVFERQKDQFIVLSSDFTSSSIQEAGHIGLTASIVECVIWDAKYLHKVIDVTNGLEAVEAYLDGMPIGIISGPSFDEALGKGVFL